MYKTISKKLTYDFDGYLRNIYSFNPITFYYPKYMLNNIFFT